SGGIPGEIEAHALRRAGLQVVDEHVERAVAVARDQLTGVAREDGETTIRGDGRRRIRVTARLGAGAVDIDAPSALRASNGSRSPDHERRRQCDGGDTKIQVGLPALGRAAVVRNAAVDIQSSAEEWRQLLGDCPQYPAFLSTTFFSGSPAAKCLRFSLSSAHERSSVISASLATCGV